jgi:hypothetical protein
MGVPRAGLKSVLLLSIVLAGRTYAAPVAGTETDLPRVSRPSVALPVVALPPAAKPHNFGDQKNLCLFAGVVATRTLDYTSTLNMLRRGNTELLLPEDVVRNHPALAALEAAGTATSIGLSYLLHRTGHHKLERALSIAHMSVAGFGAARNYSLKTHAK